MDLLGHGQVVSVDIDRTHFKVSHPRIVQVTGDSRSDDVVSRVRALCAGKTVMAIHDGDHRRDAVLSDLETYCDLVSPGSYFVVEDGIIDLFRPGDGLGSYEPGPLAAADEFLARHPEFERDSGRERYLMTYNPGGFLRRRGQSSARPS
jgi:cephalosporin hydroxylase